MSATLAPRTSPSPSDVPETNAPPSPSSVAPRTRRAVLAGLAGGAGALLANAVGRLSPARAVAATGRPLLIGRTDNNAGSADTQLLTNSTITAFTLYQQGPGTALMGYVTRTSGNGRGVYGRTDSPNGDGIQARNAGASAGSGAAIRAFGVNNDGIVASTDGSSSYAVRATNSDASADNVAVIGLAYNAAATDTHPSGGVTFFKAAGEFAGINGVIGASIPSAANGVGVVGVSPGTSGYGVYGYAPAGAGTTYGVYGRADSTAGHGVHGTGPTSSSGTGVYGSGANGVWGSTSNAGGNGVYGATTVSNSNAYAVWGVATGAGAGVVGQSDTGYAIYGYGNGGVSGSFSKASGTFKIDHPLDPTNKFLQHSFVESPDMMNVYNGVATLSGGGDATVTLPDWFEALNKDFRYQLTPIGAAAPNLHVKSGVKNNRFVIAGGAAGLDVSWQVTGIRHDAWAEAHPVEAEVAKVGAEKGKYLHPKEHGKPVSAGVSLKNSPTG